jgi:L-asparaginase II
MLRAGEAPSALHNNCSGKHSGVLATCVHCGDPVAGYLDPQHEACRRHVAAYEAMCGVNLRDAPRGIDGCGLPQIGITLRALATGMARFGAPDQLMPKRAEACRRIAKAIIAEPVMVAGTDRFCTKAIAAAGGRAVLKTGAEANFMGAIPARGLGFALKIEDGSTRASEVLAAATVLRFADLDDVHRARMEALSRTVLNNRAGAEVGAIAVARVW